MSTKPYTATVIWSRKTEEKFTDNRYSRAHVWKFDGGLSVEASSSPAVVPLPLSRADAVDPEEAFVASLSSCHMLFFLFYAAKFGAVVERYEDTAEGHMEKNSEGRQWMAKVVLRPAITWGEGKVPSQTELDEMHHKAHLDCYIANSVKTTIEIVPPTT